MAKDGADTRLSLDDILETVRISSVHSTQPDRGMSNHAMRDIRAIEAIDGLIRLAQDPEALSGMLRDPDASEPRPRLEAVHLAMSIEQRPWLAARVAVVPGGWRLLNGLRSEVGRPIDLQPSDALLAVQSAMLEEPSVLKDIIDQTGRRMQHDRRISQAATLLDAGKSLSAFSVAAWEVRARDRRWSPGSEPLSDVQADACSWFAQDRSRMLTDLFREQVVMYALSISGGEGNLVERKQLLSAEAELTPLGDPELGNFGHTIEAYAQDLGVFDRTSTIDAGLEQGLD